MEHYSSFCTFEIAILANILGHYLRKYGNYIDNSEYSQEKNPPCTALFWSARLSILRKNSTLHS